MPHELDYWFEVSHPLTLYKNIRLLVCVFLIKKYFKIYVIKELVKICKRKLLSIFFNKLQDISIKYDKKIYSKKCN